MLIHSELSTPIDRADLEPADALPGRILYHVWERTLEPMPTLFGTTTTRYFREYRGLIAAAALVWLLFPGRG